MNLGDALARDQQERSESLERQRAKFGDYTDEGCPNCKRHRMMRGADGKHRCEKCCWCVEDRDYDYEFVSYMNCLS